MKTVHVISIMLRKKDNPQLNLKRDTYVYREVYPTGNETMRQEKIAKLKLLMNLSPGTWRLYESVNPRDIEKAQKLLQHRMIDGVIKYDRIDSEWKSLLQKPDCKAGRKFLLDCDDCSKADKENVLQGLEYLNVTIHEVLPSLTGFHIITDPFDTRELVNEFPFIDVKRDDMKLLEVVVKA